MQITPDLDKNQERALQGPIVEHLVEINKKKNESERKIQAEEIHLDKVHSRNKVHNDIKQQKITEVSPISPHTPSSH